ncbi:MAG: hypothetical protein OIN87_08435 [Candidatus Methanoperedens sp.]|nr:hypothetical protein [Candidatus Methanoperedens sp.]
MDTKILFPYPDPHEATTLGTTILKEGYSLSLDDVYDHANYTQTVAVLTIYKNEEIVKRIKLKTGDYIYYNKTIGGREYIIIESKLDTIFRGTPNNIVMLKPFYQYSDGSTIIEPDFVSTNLNPKIKEAPCEEWNRTIVYKFGRIYELSVRQASDYGYILGGTIVSQNSGAGYQCFRGCELSIKVDVNGNEQWNKTSGYFGNQQLKKSFDLGDAQSIQKTSDGGFILAGMSRLVKTDSNGTKQWSNTFGLDEFYRKSSVRESPYGGYPIKESYTLTSKPIVLETTDGGYILTGDIRWDDNLGMAEVLLSKIDSNGTEQWSRTLGGAENDFSYSVRNTLDGGYILAGMTFSYGTGGDAWLLKTDANGNEQWNKTFGLDGPDRVNSVEQTSDGGYVLAGQIDTAKNPEFKGQILYENYDAWLFKTDANGNLEWTKTIGGVKRDEAKFVQQTSDGGYVIAGTTESDSSGDSKSWLVKVGDVKVDTTQSQVIISDNNIIDNNVTDNIQTSPGKSISGFEFFGGVFSIIILLLSRRRLL